MKNSKKTILLCTVIYSFIFYKQTIGANILIFSLTILASLFYNDRRSFYNPKNQILSIGVILSSCCSVVHGSILSVWTTVFSLLLLSSTVLFTEHSILTNLVSSIYSQLTAPVFQIREIIKNKKDEGNIDFRGMLKYLVPITFGVIFFLLYKNINPLFEKYTQVISLDFISFNWILFTLIGFILILSFFKQRRIAQLDHWEANNSTEIKTDKNFSPKWNENFAIKSLFITLNLMLVLVNLMDLNYLYLDSGMPDDLTHKEFVHNGVGTLIFSIILGISILLYFFRGQLNYSKNNKTIKSLAILWIGQNIFMVLSTSIRNTMYINQALLSYKRIGVYFWLVLIVVLLLYCFFKIKNNADSSNKCEI